MLKKLTFSIVALTMILSTALIVPPVVAVDNTQVCGMDGQNYASAEAAEAAGFDVSYGFACVNPTSESGLYESESDVNFAGMLIEVGSTDVPTTLIIRNNINSEDYTVEVTADTILGQSQDQTTNLSDWIPGDQIRVIGKKNENTDTIESTILANLSIIIRSNQGANGWITAINKDIKTITYQWANVEHTFAYDDNTRFVAGLKNPATADDLAINDRIRGRLLLRADETALAKIVVVLRRGEDLFMKIRTFRPNAKLVRLNNVITPTTIQVMIKDTSGLRANDVNNLIGTKGALITVNITEDTKLVRKYFGRVMLGKFSVGDNLHIVGRVNDDGTVDAKLIKNNSIWKTSTQGHAGVVTGIDVDKSYIMVNWTPIKYLTSKKLKEKLNQADNTVIAQIVDESGDSGNTENIVATDNTINKQTLISRLQQRVKTVIAAKIGNFIRNVKYKKVVINRIKHSNITIGDLVTRLPGKKIRVDITEDTQIVVGTNDNATISDIQNGDKVRIRGTKHANLPIVMAKTIVVVNSLPEIEESLDTAIDDVNQVVSEIVTDDMDNAITNNTTTGTEKEITENGDSNCAKEGEFVNPDSLKGKTDYPDECCHGLKGLIAYAVNDEEKCEGITGTPYLTCTSCGDGICDEINEWFENKCNCPEDCE